MISHQYPAAAALLLLATSSSAAEQKLNDSEREFLVLFDAAIKSADPLDTLAKLPWQHGAKVINPQFLAQIRSCKLNYTGRFRDMLVAGWNDEATSPCKSISGVGYYANFKMKNERIRTVSLGETQIIVTSKGAH